MLSRVTDNTQRWLAKRATKLPTAAHAQAHAEHTAARLRAQQVTQNPFRINLIRRQARRAIETATRIATGGKE